MKKFLVLILLLIGGIIAYFWYILGINLLNGEDGNVGLPPFSISERMPETSSLEAGQSRWRAAAAMPTARSWATAVNLNGKIYVIGGMDGLGRTLDKVEIYDPFKDTWTDGAPLPEPRHHASVAVLNGKLYVVGGLVGVSGQPKDTVFIFDPKGSYWSEGPVLPNRLGAIGLIAVGERLHVFGGRGSFGSVGTHYVYDPLTESWEGADDMTSIRDSMALVAQDNKIWVMGGRAGTAAADLGLIEYWRLDNEAWTDPDTIQVRRSDHGAAVLNGRVYFMGGEAATVAFKDIVVYDDLTKKWLTIGEMPVPRHGFAHAKFNDMLFVIGGGQRPGWSVSDLNQVFIP